MLKQILLTCMAGAALTASACAQTGMTTGAPLNDIYLHLHQNPELSFKEKESSALMAAEAEALGFEVVTGLGQDWVVARATDEAGYLVDGVGGYGVVAVLKNGDGPTLMIRADMDALPVPEQTGADYASTKMSTAWTGAEGPVMHACGHDIHMTVWTGVARQMAANKDKWSGTLVMIAQPAEELGLGAKAMLEDGLFERFPYPDFNLALHVTPDQPAGTIGYVPGFSMANVDSVDITVKGVGGHGAYPHGAKDPIVVAAHIVTALQTLVARELDPQEPGVVTVGMINGGHKHNIIPDRADLQLTVRSYSDEVRQKLLDGIARIATAQAASAGLTGDMAPEISIKKDYTPAVYNDPDLAARVIGVMEPLIGADKIVQRTPVMGGEDFARFGRTDPRIPGFMFNLGTVSQEKYDAAKAPGGAPLPSLHSALYLPDYAPSIETGVTVMTAAAMDILGKE